MPRAKPKLVPDVEASELGWSFHGRLLTADGRLAWRCRHGHRTQAEAEECAQRALARRHARTRPGSDGPGALSVSAGRGLR